jgi:hypothetical protein
MQQELNIDTGSGLLRFFNSVRGIIQTTIHPVLKMLLISGFALSVPS